MRILVQRGMNATVSVDNRIVGKIDNGLVALVGFKDDDTIEDIKYLAKKLVNLRIFDDENHIMNKSVIDINGSILSISQFTLYADCKKGNRPSYVKAMKAECASSMYDIFNEELKKYNIDVQTGIFQTDMMVNLTNVGPVTILLESE